MVLDSRRRVGIAGEDRIARTGGDLTVARRGEAGRGGEGGGVGRVAPEGWQSCGLTDQAGSVIQQARGRSRGGVVPEGVAHNVHLQPPGGG